MTDKKITDDEIVKLLEWCVKHGNHNYDTDIVLDLINRQKSEIERQNRFIESQNELISKLAIAGKNATVEAYKEFAENAVIRLADNYRSDYARWIDYTIDNLLKEMVGEEE